jgi:hypothetical protein
MTEDAICIVLPSASIALKQLQSVEKLFQSPSSFDIAPALDKSVGSSLQMKSCLTTIATPILKKVIRWIKLSSSNWKKETQLKLRPSHHLRVRFHTNLSDSNASTWSL